MQMCTPPLYVVTNSFAIRANFKILKCGQILFLERPIPDILVFFLVNVALSVTWSGLENQGHLHEKSEDFLPVDVQHADIIPSATPTFSTLADLSMTTSTSPNIGDYRFKMAATKTELEITFER